MLNNDETCRRYKALYFMKYLSSEGGIPRTGFACKAGDSCAVVARTYLCSIWLWLLRDWAAGHSPGPTAGEFVGALQYRLPGKRNSEETDEACPAPRSVLKEGWRACFQRYLSHWEPKKTPLKRFPSSWQPMLGSVSACFPASYITWTWREEKNK